MAKFKNIRLDSLNPSEDLNTKDHAVRMTKILKDLYANRENSRAMIEIINHGSMIYVKKFAHDNFVSSTIEWSSSKVMGIRDVELLNDFEKFVKWGSYKRIYRRSHRWQNLWKFLIPFLLGIVSAVIAGLLLYLIIRQ